MEALETEDVEGIKNNDNTVWTCTTCGHQNNCRHVDKKKCENCGADMPIKVIKHGNMYVSFHNVHDWMLDIEGKIHSIRYILEELEKEVEAVHGFLRANVELDTYRPGLDLGD